MALNFPNPIKKIFDFGQTGVHVFFLISGFIITFLLNKSNYKIKNLFRFLLKRSIRIDPPYYIMLLLCVAYFNFMAYHSDKPPNFLLINNLQFVSHILYLIPFTKFPFYMHVFWTLCIEFQFYILIGLIYFASKKSLYQYLFLILFSLSSFLKLPNSEYLVFSYAPIFALLISLVNLYKIKLYLT